MDIMYINIRNKKTKKKWCYFFHISVRLLLFSCTHCYTANPSCVKAKAATHPGHVASSLQGHTERQTQHLVHTNTHLWTMLSSFCCEAIVWTTKPPRQQAMFYMTINYCQNPIKDRSEMSQCCSISECSDRKKSSCHPSQCLVYLRFRNSSVIWLVSLRKTHTQLVFQSFSLAEAQGFCFAIKFWHSDMLTICQKAAVPAAHLPPRLPLRLCVHTSRWGN